VARVLITGASGFIGKALCEAMAPSHHVVAMSRKKVELPGVTAIAGDFANHDDLRQLDRHDIDVAIHLAAVTGGCDEGDGIMVNVEGTRRLMRYLIDRGTRKFVMASSIAVVGMQNTAFVPKQVPIADDHPCLDRDGYGLSKYLMEEVTDYHARQVAELDVTNFRLSVVLPDDAKPGGMRELCEWALGSITAMVRRDAVRLFTMAAKRAHEPGVRTMNASCSRVWATVPTADLLRHWYGRQVDTSYFDVPANRYASAYDVQHLQRTFNFEATDTLAILRDLQK